MKIKNRRIRAFGVLKVAFCIVYTALPGYAELNQLTPEEKEEGWELLFNGVDTSGWTVCDGSEWSVVEGALIGPSQGAGWLGTANEYDNFYLKLEYWVDRGDTHESNSGIFLRADRNTKDPWVNGYEIQISLQDANNPTGSIYNRVPTHLEYLTANSIAPEQTWNQVEIRCLGPRIQVWVNGHPLQDAFLHVRDRGAIGLQQHHPGVTIKFQNVKLLRLDDSIAETGWERVGNGQNLEGWTASGNAKWSVDEEGGIAGHEGMGHLLYTAQAFSNVEIRAMVWLQENDNSGLYLRAKVREDDPTLVDGYEVQLSMSHPTWKTGDLFGLAHATAYITQEGRWFALRMRCHGNQVQIWINGMLVVDYVDAEDRYKEGFLALQGHDADSHVIFKDVYYRVSN